MTVETPVNSYSIAWEQREKTIRLIAARLYSKGIKSPVIAGTKGVCPYTMFTATRTMVDYAIQAGLVVDGALLNEIALALNNIEAKYGE